LPGPAGSATDEPSTHELALRLLAELDSPDANDESRLEAATAALTSVAWQVKRERARRHHEVLRELLGKLFPEHDFESEPDERLAQAAIAQMTLLRSSISAGEARALQLSDALTAMQDVLSAIASLRRG
jgi:exopolyphosphatase/pppGpp-phosphohydrolase